MIRIVIRKRYSGQCECGDDRDNVSDVFLCIHFSLLRAFD
jgi:hypothetical protein